MFYRVSILVILSPGEEVSGKAMSCSFIWINDTIIDVPDDNCLYIGDRTKRRRLSRDTFHAQEKSKYPRNTALVVPAYESIFPQRNSYTCCPEAYSYLNALPVLNVKTIFTYNLYHEDIIIEPSITTVEMLHTHDIGGM